jgi:hypothetical protein
MTIKDTIVGDLVGSLPSPYIPKTNSHFASLWLPSSIVLAGLHLLVHCRPLSSLAHTSSSTVAPGPCRHLCLAVPESISLKAPRISLSIVLAASCLVLMQTPAVLLASYPSCAIPVHPCLSNKGEVDKIRQSRANHCLTPPCFRVRIVSFFWSGVDNDCQR